ncbi:uncharacterized protein METZ01_LOCUS363762, partial [marine metagenome]
MKNTILIVSSIMLVFTSWASGQVLEKPEVMILTT